MKQKDIHGGKEYLFALTEFEHKKDMVGTIVKVAERIKGKKKIDYFGTVSYNPMRFKLSNGRYANAAELKEL